MMRSILVAAAGFAVCGSSFAAIIPFTETFSSPAANWSSGAAFTPLNYLPAGGPDGSGFGSAPFTFAAATVGTQPLLFRGQSNFGSSGNAFVGNWITEGVTGFSFSVRHNGPAPIEFFSRFSPSSPGPGAVALALPPAQPNVWTTYNVPINPAAFFIFEGTTFASTFSSVGRVQIGLTVASGFTDVPIVFDIDNVSIIPAPSAAGLLGLGAIGGLRRRRR